MKKIICFLCLMNGLFFMGCEKDIAETKVNTDEPIMDIEKKEEIISFEEDKEINEKYSIVYDFKPQDSPLIMAIIEHGYPLSREDYFEIFGHYPDDHSIWGEPVKYSQGILDLNN